MSRHFTRESGSDWLSVYLQWAVDDFCPYNFHLWCGITGLSCLAERRIWLNHGRRKIFPNIYSFLIAKPSVGKSTALDAINDGILRQVKGKGAMSAMGINFLAQQTSEAAFYKPQLTNPKPFYIGNEQFTQSPGFMLMPEAGNSLKEISGGGGIFDALTEFYDCPSHWKKTLVNDTINLTNVAVSFLGACTFVSLPKIIPRQNLEGGLASRCVFVPEFGHMIRSPAFRDLDVNRIIQKKLVEDAQQMFEMSGEMTIDKELEAEWGARHAASDRARMKAPNTQIECLIARRFIIIEKLAILVSMSESASKVITRDNWIRAEGLYDAQARHLPQLLEFSSVTDDQKTLTETIIRFIGNEKKPKSEVQRFMLTKGLEPFRIDNNIDAMVKYNMLAVLPGNFICVADGVLVNDKTDIAISSNVRDVKTKLLPTEVAH